MRGLILTGALGSGKTTAQNLLVSNHNFWTPLTVTTRDVSGLETFMLSVPFDKFTKGVNEVKYVLPYRFGQHWYAWRSSDFEHLIFSKSKRSVVNVRPYTALLLSAFRTDLIPVWLWVEPEELQRRLTKRADARDTEPELRSLRRLQDEEDRSYELLFSHRVRSDDKMVDSLLRLLGKN